MTQTIADVYRADEITLSRENAQMEPFTDILRSRIADRFPIQADVATAAQVSPMSISRFLAGHSGISADTLDALWPHLGLKISPGEYDKVVKKHGFSEMLRQAIADQDLPILQIAHASGVPQPTLQRFMSGTVSDLRISIIGRLLPALGIRVIES